MSQTLKTVLKMVFASAIISFGLWGVYQFLPTNGEIRNVFSFTFFMCGLAIAIMFAGNIVITRRLERADEDYRLEYIRKAKTNVSRSSIRVYLYLLLYLVAGSATYFVYLGTQSWLITSFLATIAVGFLVLLFLKTLKWVPALSGPGQVRDEASLDSGSNNDLSENSGHGVTESPSPLEVRSAMSWLKRIAFSLSVGSPLAYACFAYWFARNRAALSQGDQGILILLVLTLVSILIQGTLKKSSMRASSNRSRGSKEMWLSYTRFVIIRLALASATYVYGLLSFMWTGKISYMIAFYAVGVIWSIIVWPRQAQLDLVARDGWTK